MLSCRSRVARFLREASAHHSGRKEKEQIHRVSVMLYEAEARGSFSKDVFCFPGQGLGSFHQKYFPFSRCRVRRRGFILTDQVAHFSLSAFRRPGGSQSDIHPLCCHVGLYMVE